MSAHTHMEDARDSEADEQRALGIRLRTLRKTKRMSLREVAALAEVSESFLSQIERGLTSPSIASLRRICAALGESMGALFDDSREPDQADPHLVRYQDRRRIFRPDGSANYLITPLIAKDLEIHQNVIAPGRNSGAEPYSHQGKEECVIVLEGRLHFEWNGNTYELGTGDAVLIDPKIGHSFSNDTKENAVVMWVISPARHDI
ncbi:cupin domain-containing protein [Leucobacter sp. USCH14]|uniref:cupin domain-containing protein n=1 Tax=Leucobacter sp. USCH14 TaxID=3024838 RepID=UPI0030AB81DF